MFPHVIEDDKRIYAAKCDRPTAVLVRRPITASYTIHDNEDLDLFIGAAEKVVSTCTKSEPRDVLIVPVSEARHL